ncbi:MAG: transglutaminase domain-containing protein [Deltaproteobacteria bacterium]|nr:transglutaminase domain-containing protein [Deltaproteobacteria bacterium]
MSTGPRAQRLLGGTCDTQQSNPSNLGIAHPSNAVSSMALFVALLLLGDARPAETAPILHEPVPPPKSRNSGQPRPPSRSDPRRYSSDRPKPSRLKPDRHTDNFGSPLYRIVFSPTVAPYKRTAVFDRVARDGSLFVGDPRLTPVPVGRTHQDPTRQRFEAVFILSLAQRAPHPRSAHLYPIASVAPNMTPDRVRVIPPRLHAQFLKDGADNFYVKLVDATQTTALAQPVTITVQLSAPASYFGGALPVQMTTRSPNRILLPHSLRRAAARVARHIGVRPSDRFGRILSKLVGYFRSFSTGPLTRHTGNDYLDIALSRRGVCRHRAYAFVITALALGLQARYVTNETHAFVEVRLPRISWRRIDLGGAVPNLRPAQRQAVVHHVPGPDPLPWPARSQSAADVMQGRRKGRSVASSEFGAAAPGSGGRHGRPKSARSTHRLRVVEFIAEPAWAPSSGRTSGTGPTTGPTQPSRPARSGGLDLTTVPLGRLRVSGGAYRGRPITIGGTIADSAGRSSRINILLHAPKTRIAIVLGQARTDALGRFVLRITLPKNLVPGLYEVHAVVVGRNVP